MDINNVEQKLAEMDKKLDKIFESSEQTRKYFLTTLIVSLVLFVLPLIGLLVAIPSFLDTYSSLGP